MLTTTWCIGWIKTQMDQIGWIADKNVTALKQLTALQYWKRRILNIKFLTKIINQHKGLKWSIRQLIDNDLLKIFDNL